MSQFEDGLPGRRADTTTATMAVLLAVGVGTKEAVMFRSARFWVALLVGVLIASIVLSSLFTEEGNNNDPFLAELGNAGMPLAVLGLLVLGVTQAWRWARQRRSAPSRP